MQAGGSSVQAGGSAAAVGHEATWQHGMEVSVGCMAYASHAAFDIMREAILLDWATLNPCIAVVAYKCMNVTS